MSFGKGLTNVGFQYDSFFSESLALDFYDYGSPGLKIGSPLDVNLDNLLGHLGLQAIFSTLCQHKQLLGVQYNFRWMLSIHLFFQQTIFTFEKNYFIEHSFLTYITYF